MIFILLNYLNQRKYYYRDLHVPIKQFISIKHIYFANISVINSVKFYDFNAFFIAIKLLYILCILDFYFNIKIIISK